MIGLLVCRLVGLLFKRKVFFDLSLCPYICWIFRCNSNVGWLLVDKLSNVSICLFDGVLSTWSLEWSYFSPIMRTISELILISLNVLSTGEQRGEGSKLGKIFYWFISCFIACRSF